MRRTSPNQRAPLGRCCGVLLVSLLLLPLLARGQTDAEALVEKPLAAKNADGHLELFKVDVDGELRHRWQKVSNGDWSSWNSLGDACLPGIATANGAKGELWVFAVDSKNKALKYARQKAPNSLDWSPWTYLGGLLHPPLAVVQTAEGRLHVYAVDRVTCSVKHIGQTATPDAWSEWKDLGASVKPGLAVERNPDGRLELFAIESRTKGLIHCFQRQPDNTDSWSPWLPLGGSVSPGFVVRANMLGLLEVFAVNRTNSHLQRICQMAPGQSQRWTNWMEFGLIAKQGITVGKSGDGRVEVFAVQTSDSHLMHKWEILPNGADIWSDWARLGSTAQPYPAVVANEDGDFEVFALDVKEPGVLNHRRQISRASDWLDWARLEHPTFQYSSRSWQRYEGLPDNVVRALAQTSDGYLWVGTRAGLARFDGLAFTTFKADSAPELSSASISALSADKAGSLWIGTHTNGLYRLLNGRCTHYGIADGLAANSINVVYERRDGSLWIGTSGGLSRFDKERFTTYTRQQGLSSDIVRALFEDSDGNLWIATGEGLNRMRGNLMDSFPMPDGLPNDSVRCICQDRGGRIWIGSSNGMLWYGSYWGKFFAYNSRFGLSDPFVSAICEDREGNLWVGTYSGLNRFHQGRFLTERNNEGAPFDRVNVLFEDRESNLWVGSREGLVRLTPKRFSTFTRHQGLTHNNVMSVVEARDGSLWMGTWGGGLTRLKDDRATAFASTNNLSQMLVLSLTEGKDGSLWLGADFEGGLSRLKDGVFTNYTWKHGLPRAPIRVLHEDQAGRLWVGTGNGLSCFKAGTFTNYTVKEGLANNAIRAICEDHAGNLWFGTEGGLSRWQNGQLSSFTTSNGLSDDTILALYEDKEHELWIGTAKGGLNRMSLADAPPASHVKPDGTRNAQKAPSSAPALPPPASRITAYTTSHGLFSDEIFEILEDEQGWLWMSCSKGVFRVKKRDCYSLDQGNRESLISLVYGKSDGMESPQCNGGGKPAGWKTRDGHLCFVTSKGVAIVDPNTVNINLAPPPVRIEEVLADRVSQAGPKGHHAAALGCTLWTAPFDHPTLQIPPGRGELEFRYTALTFQSPEETRFKYKLENVDADWVDAGPRRIAHYNNLSPGAYKFRVLACNKDGAWNERGAEVALVLHPYFWQTWWFRTTLVLVVLGSTGGIVRFITRRRLQRRLALLEQRHAIEKERGRIAKDIHDDLGSSLTRIMMLGERAEEHLQANSAVEPHISKIVATARHTVRALDEIVWAVNPENDTLEGLVQYITHYTDEFFENTPVRCRLEMPDALPAVNLTAEVRHDLFLVVKEAFNNVLKHSRASQVQVRLAAADSRFELVLEDNGCGFTSTEPTTGRKGNGLPNMRKRIEAIGGQLELTSAPGQGTRLKIALHLPAHSTAA